MDFANTVYAKNLFEHQLPQLIKSLDRVADGLEKAGSSTRAMPVSTMLSGTVDTVYVCYEENSVALYPDAGNVNRMFATTDIELAREWAKRSIENARANDYLPYDDEDYAEFMAGIGQEFASVWVYRGGNDKARENYGICVDTYSLGQSKEKLDQLFA